MQHAEILPIYVVKLPDPAKSTMTYVFFYSLNGARISLT